LIATVLAAVGGCASWTEPASAADAAPSARDRPDDRDLAGLVPAGAETVIEMDLVALRRSPFTAEALVNPDARLRDRSAAALGYDADTDVDRMVYATGAAGADAPTLVIAQGRFQVANVEAAFRERWSGATTDRWRGVPLLVNGENALASISPRTFVSGAPPRVRAAIDRAFGVGPDFLDAGDAAGQGVIRRDLLGFTETAAPAVLVLMTVDERMRARVGDTFPLPRTLRSVGVRLDAGESLRLHALGVLDDREAAAAMALSAFGLGDLLDGARVAADGARVRLSLAVGPEQRTPIAGALRTIVQALRTGADPRAGGSW
jgi:hypothetical protein